MGDTKTLGLAEMETKVNFSERNSVLTHIVKDQVQRGWKEFMRDK